ncbi:MAG: recombinase family protein [Proteobacteria bacterium]|nr:recombinase family protein [Pseudomonadota bacterium]
MEKKLRFAPLIRVSTEGQAKRGESLYTQRKQLKSAIESLDGTVYQWYAGQEHATPDQERKILNELIQDAQHQKFDAVMVADMSRWSRDNRKSKKHLDILKHHNIRFYVGTREFNLYEPLPSFMLGMGIEVAEFFAKEQAYKSIINRIERAKKGYPSCGRRPFGRTFDKEIRMERRRGSKEKDSGNSKALS